MFKNKRIRYVETYEDMLKIINIAKEYAPIYDIKKDYEYDGKMATLRNASYIINKDKFIHFTTMYVQDIEKEDKIEYVAASTEKYACTWIFDKSGEYSIPISPVKVAMEINKIYKVYNEINKEDSVFTKAYGKILESAKPLLGYNEKFNNTEHYVYCYDLNSAYATVLKDKIIDTYHWRTYDIVRENEVGFNIDSDLRFVPKGEVAARVYKLIDSPFKEYVKKYYEMKRKAPSGSREKKIAKAYLNYCVGLFQKKNPFLRAYIVNSCNEYIKNIINRHKDIVCMWNTDAIYSVEPIEELEIGTDIGQWKLEYQGLFRQKDNSYQKVEKNEVTYRGISKCLFQKDWNLLTDPLPVHIFKYYWNKEDCELQLNPNWKGEE